MPRVRICGFDDAARFVIPTSAPRDKGIHDMTVEELYVVCTLHGSLRGLGAGLAGTWSGSL